MSTVVPEQSSSAAGPSNTQRLVESQPPLEIEPAPMDMDPPSPVSSAPCQIPSPDTSPQTTSTGRPHRKRMAPQRFRDIRPEPATPIPPIRPRAVPENDPPTIPQRVRLIVRDTVRTAANAFGLWREYPHRPSHEPDAFLQPEDLSNHDDLGPRRYPILIPYFLLELRCLVRALPFLLHGHSLICHGSHL